MYPGDVIGSARTQTFADTGKLCLRVLACMSWSNRNSKRDVTVHCRDEGGQSATSLIFPSEVVMSRPET